MRYTALNVDNENVCFMHKYWRMELDCTRIINQTNSLWWGTVEKEGPEIDPAECCP